MATRRATAKPAPEPEVVEDEFEDMDETDEVDDLEEIDEDDDTEDEAPAKPTKKAAAPKKAADRPKFGSAELAAYITEETGEKYDARAVRMLLRKMASDGTLARVVGETRDRYSFSGPKDPTVQAVLTMVQDGTAKALKQAGLQAVKDKAAEKRAAAKAAKAAAEPEDDEDMEELEEEAPAPKPTTRRRAAAPAKAAPAKATAAKPTTRRASAKA